MQPEPKNFQPPVIESSVIEPVPDDRWTGWQKFCCTILVLQILIAPWVFALLFNRGPDNYYSIFGGTCYFSSVLCLTIVVALTKSNILLFLFSLLYSYFIASVFSDNRNDLGVGLLILILGISIIWFTARILGFALIECAVQRDGQRAWRFVGNRWQIQLWQIFVSIILIVLVTVLTIYTQQLDLRYRELPYLVFGMGSCSVSTLVLALGHYRLLVRLFWLSVVLVSWFPIWLATHIHNQALEEEWRWDQLEFELKGATILFMLILWQLWFYWLLRQLGYRFGCAVMKQQQQPSIPIQTENQTDRPSWLDD